MKTESLPVMHRRGGYEIRGNDDQIVFILRRTYGPGIGATVSGGLAGIFIANGILQLLLNRAGAGLAILLPGICILAVFALFMRTYLGRKKARPEEVPVRYLMNLAADSLKDASGNTLARLKDISLICSYNFFSRVYGLFLQFPPKKKIRVYGEWVTGFSSAHVKRVKEELERTLAALR